MSLHDKMRCATCGHARHWHSQQWTRTVLGEHTTHYGHCTRQHCACKGFREPTTPLRRAAESG